MSTAQIIPLKCRYCGAPLPEPTDLEAPHPASLNSYIICPYCGMKYLIAKGGVLEEEALPALAEEPEDESEGGKGFNWLAVAFLVVSVGAFLFIASLGGPLGHSTTYIPQNGPVAYGGPSDACTGYYTVFEHDGFWYATICGVSGTIIAGGPHDAGGVNGKDSGAVLQAAINQAKGMPLYDCGAKLLTSVSQSIDNVTFVESGTCPP